VSACGKPVPDGDHHAPIFRADSPAFEGLRAAFRSLPANVLQMLSFAMKLSAQHYNFFASSAYQAGKVEAAMGMIMFRCPETGHSIETGMEMEAARFQRMPVFFSRSYCPHCRLHHEWFAAHAWVEEVGERRESIELA
jgi:hypothetical protein